MPLAICWDGRSGACSADIADDADGPEVAEFTVCGRAVDIPVAGSALPGGQSPLVGFFRAAQLPGSVATGVAPLVCTDDAVIVDAVEFVEVVDEIEVEEFCRWAVFLGPGVNILLTSSDMPPRPLPLDVHPIRVLGWNDKGDATAVI